MNFNNSVELITNFMSNFGPLVLTGILVYLAGKYLVIPVIREYYIPVRTRLNAGKEPANALIDMEILCKRAWGGGGIIMLLALTTVSDMILEIEVSKSAYAFSAIGIGAGYRGYNELLRLRDVAKIFSSDIFRNRNSGLQIKVVKIIHGLIIGETPRPHIRRGVIKISDILDGHVEDLGPYGVGEVYSFEVDTKHDSYTPKKGRQWRKAVRDMLAKRDDINVVMNGKYVIPEITFIISAKSCDSDERDIDIYSDVSVAIEHITLNLGCAFIAPMVKKKE